MQALLLQAAALRAAQQGGLLLEAQQQGGGFLRRAFAAAAASASKGGKAASSAAGGGAPAPAVSKQEQWKAVKVPDAIADAIPVTKLPGQAFVGDMRSTSGLGLGDGKATHTSKWLTAGAKSPMDYIQETEPIKVDGLVVASYGSDDPNLGCPVEYISLKGTSYERPAVCKYTGNKFYSDSWKGGGHH